MDSFDFRDGLFHSYKGTTWKKHKYQKKVNGRYIYPKNYRSSGSSNDSKIQSRLKYESTPASKKTAITGGGVSAIKNPLRAYAIKSPFKGISIASNDQGAALKSLISSSVAKVGSTAISNKTSGKIAGRYVLKDRAVVSKALDRIGAVSILSIGNVGGRDVKEAENKKKKGNVKFMW